MIARSKRWRLWYDQNGLHSLWINNMSKSDFIERFDACLALISKGAVSRVITLTDLRAHVRQRKAELGLSIVDTPERTEALRNKGLNRTSEKRELLRRSQERAIAAGVQPIKAYF
jgi:hypothetical protein